MGTMKHSKKKKNKEHLSYFDIIKKSNKVINIEYFLLIWTQDLIFMEDLTPTQNTTGPFSHVMLSLKNSSIKKDMCS